MSSHELAVAKATFSAGLMRPDPIPISREEITNLHNLLNGAIVQCTPENVQKCKQWIMENIVQSTARCTALGKYLTALTNSLAKSAITSDTSNRQPSLKRKRLHLLYIINDILFHTQYRTHDASVSGKIRFMLVSLFASAGSFSECPKHLRKILDLLNIWEEHGYYAKDYIAKLRQTVENASESGNLPEGEFAAEMEEEGIEKMAKSVPYVMPAMHGDASTPWFDLPAGNYMPHIVPNSTRPINPEMIQPLQFVAGPADEKIVLAVKSLLQDVEAIYGGEVEDGKLPPDMDELGQPIIIDGITGDVLQGEGYYGWSRSFCEKMKNRGRGEANSRQRSRDPSRSRSRSSSPDGRKRRYSDSSGYSSQPRQRRRAYSSTSSRSPSPNGYGPSLNGGAPRADREHEVRRPEEPLPPLASSTPYNEPPMQAQNYAMPLPSGQGPNMLPPHFLPPPPPPPPQNGFYNGSLMGGWQPPQNMPFNHHPPSGPWPAPPPPPPPIPSPQQQMPGYVPNGGGWPGQLLPGDGRGYHQGYGYNNDGYQRRGGHGHHGGGWS